jgi:hypothetical protein
MMRLLVAILFFCSSSALAIDTSIRVLGVYPQGASIDGQYMRDQLTMISSAWNATALAASSGIAVEVLNGSNPVSAVLAGMPTTNVPISSWAPSHPNLVSVRSSWSADVIVLFSPYFDPGSCGATQAGFANGNFVADAQGMDLTYANYSYVSVVSPGCDPTTAAHEFGHLFGAGHRTDGSRLYEDARAYSLKYTQYYDQWGYSYEVSSTMGHPVECPSMGGSFCAFMAGYSRSGVFGDGAHQNARTLNLLAKSLANYIGTPTQPAPVLYPPINVHGYLINACDEYGWTRHQAHWNDDPRTNIAVSGYEVWFSQAPGQPYAFGWWVPFIQKFSDVYVIGADSDIRVNACTTSQCSALSASSYLAQWSCGGS